MSVEVGVFVVPSAEDPQATIDQAIAADEAGLDVIAIQDHPYQRRFFDTWTLLSYLAGRTSRAKLVPDVANLPLRLPSVLAKSAASLDVLSGGRVELGIGAGAFWDAIDAMGGPRRTPGESIDALEEAIAIIRPFLRGERSATLEGEHYTVKGAKPGPAPAHPVGIWIGALGPRMLRLTGRLGDGWLPSLGRLERDPLDYHRVVDEAAEAAGRDPPEIRRAVNVGVEGSPQEWADQLARVATELRFETLIVTVPDQAPLEFIRTLGGEVAPRVREAAGGSP
jgi:alkanesulfonate monooxygenase SsuD/methylene tetrahydromethanopterin reductase-like flavin-dependent oxidoreductase (luciferase family)